MEQGDTLLRIEFVDKGATPYVCMWKVDAFTNQGVWLVFEDAVALEKDESEVGFKVGEPSKDLEQSEKSHGYFTIAPREFRKPYWHNKRLWRKTPTHFAHSKLKDAIKSAKKRNRHYERHVRRDIKELEQRVANRYEALGQTSMYPDPSTIFEKRSTWGQ